MSLITNNIHPSWNEFINDSEVTLTLLEVENQIGENYYPTKENVLRFLSLDLNNLKYVFLGMDPYYTSTIVDGKEMPDATGRSFEVANYSDWTKPTRRSLVNILKNIYSINNKKESITKVRNEIKNGNFDISTPDKWFDEMEKQGVLFLNTALTVYKKPGSHMDVWEPFTKKLINYINTHNSEVTWLLLGNDAKEVGKKYIDEERYLTAPHPAHPKFLKSNILKLANKVNWKGK